VIAPQALQLLRFRVTVAADWKSLIRLSPAFTDESGANGTTPAPK